MKNWVNAVKKALVKCNVDGFDRGIRIGAGALLVAWALFDDLSSPLWGFVGLFPLLTGAFGWCPSYLLLGWSTCSQGQSVGARHSQE